MFSSKDARHSTADPNSEINAEVDKQRKRRVAYLRSVDRKELLAMPPSFDEEVLIEDAPVVFTTMLNGNGTVISSLLPGLIKAGCWG